MIIGVLAVAYGSVPLYKTICQQTGWGGQPIRSASHSGAETEDDVAAKLTPVTSSRRLRITFLGSTSDILPWKFTPQQREVRILPGETALAFYTATNKSQDEDIIGVATYSVSPAQVAPYFSKIQCFCFEEQRLNKGETVDMPVFFYIDPEFLRDPNMKGIDTISLNYTFFSKSLDRTRAGRGFLADLTIQRRSMTAKAISLPFPHDVVGISDQCSVELSMSLFSTNLPAPNVFLAGHDDTTGKAIVHSHQPSQRKMDESGQISMSAAYTTSFPPDLNQDADISTHQGTMARGHLGLVRGGATVLGYVDLAAGSQFSMHRMQSLDYGIVLEGQVGRVLDSGQTSVLRRGNVMVQRATMHAWRNLSAGLSAGVCAGTADARGYGGWAGGIAAFGH